MCIYTQLSSSTSKHVSKRDKKICVPKKHTSITGNSLKVETTPVSINRMDIVKYRK